MVADLLRPFRAAELRARAGVVLSGAVPDELAATLYGLGFRRYATPAGHTETLRLQLGQAV